MAVLSVLAATYAPSPILTTGIVTALLIAATLLLAARNAGSGPGQTAAH